MIKIRSTTEEDVRSVVSRAKEIYEGERSILTDTLLNASNSPAFSLVDGHNVVGCIVGGYVIWDGVLRVWAVTTDQIDLHPIAYSRKILQLLNGSMTYYNAHRVEATVKKDFPKAIQWADFFGFEIEGLLHKYGPDKSDYYMMGRVR